MTFPAIEVLGRTSVPHLAGLISELDGLVDEARYQVPMGTPLVVLAEHTDSELRATVVRTRVAREVGGRRCRALVDSLGRSGVALLEVGRRGRVRGHLLTERVV